MPIERGRELRVRLLDLFPKETITETEFVTESRKKADAISEVVNGAEVDDLYRFVNAHFGHLHQHVYVFRWEGDDLDPTIPFNEEPIGNVREGNEQHHFYLLERNYQLVLDSPLEHAQLTFAWPVKLVVAPDHLRVHFTIMAKTPSAYVDEERGVVRSVPYPTESDLLDGLQMAGGIAGQAPRMDLNRGIKALWDADEYDSSVVKYKRARATSRDVMDEDFTVKAHDPDLYQELNDKPLFGTTFEFMQEDPCIEYFIADPSKGSITFRRHSSTNDCVDRVIREIIGAN